MFRHLWTPVFTGVTTFYEIIKSPGSLFLLLNLPSMGESMKIRIRNLRRGEMDPVPPL